MSFQQSKPFPALPCSALTQQCPDREFCFRLSYIEIYNEVINDLLDPTRSGLQLRVAEVRHWMDFQIALICGRTTQ
jgi:hypothetical protein